MNALKTLHDGTVIHSCTIGQRRILSAWEPTTHGPVAFYGHHTVARFDGLEGTYGRIGTDSLPPEIEALPRGTGRTVAVAAWLVKHKERAYCAIAEGCPEAAGGARRDGEIEIAAAAT